MGESDGQHSVSVAGVIVDDAGRALLVQRRDNACWEPPGGVLERDETIVNGLRREIREETGLEVEPICLTGVYKNMSKGIVALVFRCDATEGELTLNPEVAAFRWAEQNELTEMMLPAYAIRVTDAVRYDGAPAVREHDGTHLLPPSASSPNRSDNCPAR